MSPTVTRWGWLFLLAGVLATPAPAPAQDDATAPDGAVSADSTAVDLYDLLDAMACDELQEVLYTEVPRIVYDDRPDALYELIVYLAGRCDLEEPLGRVQILASIWDGNFAEIIYGYEVIDWLALRWGPGRQPATNSAAALFDAFTVDFANQLLPHQESGTVEQFFCLFYSGRQDEAWALLRGEDLEDTWLRYYYDEEIEILTHYDSPYIVTAYWGRWWPDGDLDFVEPKHLAGASVEQWTTWGFLRLVIESRLGRTGRPYFVNHEGVSGFSDRWNTLLFAFEGGFALWRQGRHLAEGFVGLGYDAVKPFKDEDVAPSALNLSLGAGWRTHLDRSQRWFVRLDGRFEWIGGRNDAGTPLGGHAFSARLGLGLRLGRNPEPRLEALGQRGE